MRYGMDPVGLAKFVDTHDLFQRLDVLIQSGVAHARVLKGRINNPEVGRKADEYDEHVRPWNFSFRFLVLCSLR